MSTLTSLAPDYFGCLKDYVSPDIESIIVDYAADEQYIVSRVLLAAITKDNKTVKELFNPANVGRVALTLESNSTGNYKPVQKYNVRSPIMKLRMFVGNMYEAASNCGNTEITDYIYTTYIPKKERTIQESGGARQGDTVTLVPWTMNPSHREIEEFLSKWKDTTKHHELTKEFFKWMNPGSIIDKVLPMLDRSFVNFEWIYYRMAHVLLWFTYLGVSLNRCDTHELYYQIRCEDCFYSENLCKIAPTQKCKYAKIENGLLVGCCDKSTLTEFCEQHCDVVPHHHGWYSLTDLGLNTPKPTPTPIRIYQERRVPKVTPDVLEDDDESEPQPILMTENNPILMTENNPSK
ncbi:MAG: hypothetical protein Solumvirus7_7 [Solumvirus sp.]|uniref:Uncharacterized protein n=1 Tax=Solumvirus sp. TaxID=2487773 RepID=A0A3G5AGT3_9VIRU|nr:MAG: hypothetical protein Solumvirus7_7 [Solumvirus sp.]